jgi:hypothetical protein
MSPFALLVWRLPMVLPIWLSPLEFLTTAAPSISRSRTLPDPVVTSAEPATWSTLISPLPVDRCRGPVSSRREAPPSRRANIGDSEAGDVMPVDRRRPMVSRFSGARHLSVGTGVPPGHQRRERTVSGGVR